MAITQRGARRSKKGRRLGRKRSIREKMERMRKRGRKLKRGHRGRPSKRVRIPNDPIKLARAITILKRNIKRIQERIDRAGGGMTKSGRERAPRTSALAQYRRLLQKATAQLEAHLAVARDMIEKGELDDKGREALAKVLAAPAPAPAPAPKPSKVTGKGRRDAEQPSATGTTAPPAAPPEAPAVDPEGAGEPETPPAEAAKEIEGAKEGGGGIMAWLWPAEKPAYKRPAVWIAGVVGVAALFAGVKVATAEKTKTKK